MHTPYIDFNFEIVGTISHTRAREVKDAFITAGVVLEKEWGVSAPTPINVYMQSDHAFRAGATQGPQSWKYCFLLRDYAPNLYCNVAIFDILPTDACRMIKHELAHVVVVSLVKNEKAYKASYLLEEGTAGLDGAHERLIEKLTSLGMNDIPNPLKVKTMADVKALGGDTNKEPFIDQLGYLIQFSFVTFLREQYGEKNVITVYQACADKSIEVAFENICNQPLSDVVAAWKLKMTSLMSSLK